MADEAQQSTTTQNRGGCGPLFWFVIAILIIGNALSGKNSDPSRVSSLSSNTGSYTAQQSTPSPIPAGAHYIELYGGVDPDTATDEELSDGLNRSKEELAQVFNDMEDDFYTDSFTLLWTAADIPAGVFWVDSWVRFSMTDESTGESYYRYQINYSCTKEERDRMQLEVDQAANAILSQIDSSYDAWAKAYVIHNALIRSMSYDYSKSKDHIRDIYGALVKHEAVCAGYAKAFEYLMKQVGVTAVYDSSTFSPDEEGNTHAWNCMWADGVLYCIDVTWDDSDYTDRFGRPYYKYDFFGLTTEELMRVDSHEGMFRGVVGETASAERSLSFHVRAGAVLQYYDRSWLTNIFRNQYEYGSNTLTVKFTSQEAYESAMCTLCGAGWRDWSDVDTSELWTVLEAAAPGYDETIYIANNDELYVLNVYLYPPG